MGQKVSTSGQPVVPVSDALSKPIDYTRSMQSYFTATTTPRYVFMALQETSTSDRGLPDFSSHLLELYSDTNMYDPKE